MLGCHQTLLLGVAFVLEHDNTKYFTFPDKYVSLESSCNITVAVLLCDSSGMIEDGTIDASSGKSFA